MASGKLKLCNRSTPQNEHPLLQLHVIHKYRYSPMRLSTLDSVSMSLYSNASNCGFHGNNGCLFQARTREGTRRNIMCTCRKEVGRAHQAAETQKVQEVTWQNGNFKSELVCCPEWKSTILGPYVYTSSCAKSRQANLVMYIPYSTCILYGSRTVPRD